MYVLKHLVFLISESQSFCPAKLRGEAWSYLHLKVVWEGDGMLPLPECPLLRMKGPWRSSHYLFLARRGMPFLPSCIQPLVAWRRIR